MWCQVWQDYFLLQKTYGCRGGWTSEVSTLVRTRTTRTTTPSMPTTRDVGERQARAVVEPGAPSLSTRTLRSPRHGDRRYYQVESDYATTR